MVESGPRRSDIQVIRGQSGCSGRTTALLMVAKTRDPLEAFVKGLQMKSECSASGTD